MQKETENGLLQNEQKTKQLEDWAQTVLTLINRFEDHLRQLSVLAAVEAAASPQKSPCEPPLLKKTSTAVATARPFTQPLPAEESTAAAAAGPVTQPPPAEEESTAVATARPLSDSAKDINYHCQGIAMIRMEFSKVG